MKRVYVTSKKNNEPGSILVPIALIVCFGAMSYFALEYFETVKKKTVPNDTTIKNRTLVVPDSNNRRNNN